ncbi:uncharacterized protein FOMMEDRAFT_160615 [Fomitiporia mediterranea MF3/22]|uniref:uncharacterized protein n=1 Tax=Fomitiporia mediterranea (strain MF3/22) TaxID=694068 RepID=UPI0004407358|nr:uncharacterized protein FOMMEDRAFT_160615 [Fomitiporia mediterranea MF3/22]EJC99545.1 hypothetical protein FOMMEDRAFT_160615 [Fomitiporia mediterranea MF3/22]
MSCSTSSSVRLIEGSLIFVFLSRKLYLNLLEVPGVDVFLDSSLLPGPLIACSLSAAMLSLASAILLPLFSSVPSPSPTCPIPVTVALTGYLGLRRPDCRVVSFLVFPETTDLTHCMLVVDVHFLSNDVKMSNHVSVSTADLLCRILIGDVEERILYRRSLATCL